MSKVSGIYQIASVYYCLCTIWYVYTIFGTFCLVFVTKVSTYNWPSLPYLGAKSRKSQMVPKLGTYFHNLYLPNWYFLLIVEVMLSPHWHIDTSCQSYIDIHQQVHSALDHYALSLCRKKVLTTVCTGSLNPYFIICKC